MHNEKSSYSSSQLTPFNGFDNGNCLKFPSLSVYSLYKYTVVFILQKSSLKLYIICNHSYFYSSNFHILQFFKLTLRPEKWAQEDKGFNLILDRDAQRSRTHDCRSPTARRHLPRGSKGERTPDSTTRTTSSSRSSRHR